MLLCRRRGEWGGGRDWRFGWRCGWVAAAANDDGGGGRDDDEGNGDGFQVDLVGIGFDFDQFVGVGLAVDDGFIVFCIYFIHFAVDKTSSDAALSGDKANAVQRNKVVAGSGAAVDYESSRIQFCFRRPIQPDAIFWGAALK